MRHRIGPAMQWAKPRSPKHHKYPTEGQRIEIDFGGDSTDSTDGFSAPHDLPSESLTDIEENVHERQGSNSKKSPQRREQKDSESADALRPSQKGEDESAWSYYSQQLDRLVDQQSGKQLFGRLAKGIRQGAGAIDPKSWSATSEEPRSTLSEPLESTQSSTSPNPGWLIYILPVLVIVLILVLGIMTLRS